MLVLELGWREPEDVFAPFADDAYVAWLDSGGPICGRSRWSYVAVSPFRVIRAEAGGAEPFGAVADLLSEYGLGAEAGPAPFLGGAVGFFGYELACHLERVPRKIAGALGIADMVVGFYDLVFAFDRKNCRAWLISSGFPEILQSARGARARARADWAMGVTLGPGVRASPALPRVAWREETPRAVHEAAIGRALGYIAAGDIYQANLTARFLAPRPVGCSGAQIHAALRAGSPAPFGAFLGCGEGLSICSASPERFVRLDASGRIETRPIKGTRPRGRTDAADRQQIAELELSEKDHAENLMIVDLMRNDIGRVAEIGSLRVPELLRIESFANLHHLVSAVEGRCRPGVGPIDLLRATFPGGSVTGAPKIRAMEVIFELEQSARGAYCGAIGWIGWDGAMDSSIAIRTVTVTRDMILAQAGGGIVADSNAAEEYQELRLKVRPLLKALGEEPG